MRHFRLGALVGHRGVGSGGRGLWWVGGFEFGPADVSHGGGVFLSVAKRSRDRTHPTHDDLEGSVTTTP